MWPFTKRHAPISLATDPPQGPAEVIATGHPLHINPLAAVRSERTVARLAVVREHLSRWEAMKADHPKSAHRERKIKEFRAELARLTGGEM